MLLKSKYKFSMYWNLFTEQEIDGETLMGLTDHMVSNLLPTMKAQVKLLNSRGQLQQTIGQATSSNGSTSGYVICLILLFNLISKNGLWKSTRISVKTSHYQPINPWNTCIDSTHELWYQVLIKV